MESDFERVSWDAFRASLASADGAQPIDEDAKKTAFDFLVDLCAILPRFYGDELERTRLWARIDSALRVAASKCHESAEIPDAMLVHICADTAHAMASDDLRALFERAAKIDFMATKSVISTKRLLIVCMARTAWNKEH